MKEKRFVGDGNQEKVAYELSHNEFDVLIGNMRIFADHVKTAITISNDPRRRMHPRVSPINVEAHQEAVERLHDIMGDDIPVSSEVTIDDVEVLRHDRVEIAEAVRRRHLARPAGSVILGHPTIAVAFNEIRGPIIDSHSGLIKPDIVKGMMDQFYEDAAQRVIDSAQESLLS